MTTDQAQKNQSITQLSLAAHRITAQRTVEDTLAIVAEAAHALIGARTAVATLDGGPRFAAGQVAPTCGSEPELVVALTGRDGGRFGDLRLTGAEAAGSFDDDDEATASLLARMAAVTIGRIDEERALRAARAAARNSSEHLRSLVEASPLAIIELDLDGHIRLWNPAAERLFGWKANDVVGQPIPIHQGGDSLLGRLSEVAAGHTVSLAESLRLHADGHPVDVAIEAAPTRDHAGAVTGAAVVVADLSDRTRLRDQFLQSQKLEAVGRLAGGLAHDFNNLLTAILGYCELLMMKLPDTERGRFELQEIRAAAERAAGLVDQLLTYSRRRVDQPEVLDLNAAISAVQSMLQRLLTETIIVRTDLVDEAATVRADPTRIEQIILNLATNSHDAMPDGGEFVLRTEVLEFTEPVGDLPPGPYVRLTVSDTGIGMDAETLERSFDPFFTTKEPGKGTGLGLSTVYGIVEQAGGHIRAASTSDKGTTFEILLPRVSAPRDVGKPPADEAPLDRGDETVLLVEDNRAVRELARRLLRTLGYRVLEAGNGTEALEALSPDDRIDLLVTDMVMPGMGGAELAERLWSQRPDLKVLFMSGYSDDVGMAERQPNAAFLQKPFDGSELVRLARRLLRT